MNIGPHGLYGRFIVGFVLSFVFCLTSTIASTYNVSAALSRSISEGGLAIRDTVDIRALGRDPANLIVSWAHGAAGWNYISRSGGSYDVGLGAGSDDVRGGPMGDTLFSRHYDGVSDRDSVTRAIEDSLEWEYIGWIEVIVRIPNATGGNYIFGKVNAAPTAGYGVNFQADGTIRLIFYQGGGPQSSATSGSYDDGQYHVICAVVDPAAGGYLVVDGSDSIHVTTGGAVSGISESLAIGALRTATSAGLFSGQIEYLAIYAGSPSVTDRDTLYNLLSNHLDGTESFATIQPAIDFANDEDTIRIGQGIYHEPVYLDSAYYIAGAGYKKTRLWNENLSGYHGIDLDDLSDGTTICSLWVKNFARGFNIHGNSQADTVNISYVALTENDWGVNQQSAHANDFTTVNHATIDQSVAGGVYGLTGLVEVWNSIISEFGVGGMFTTAQRVMPYYVGIWDGVNNGVAGGVILTDSLLFLTSSPLNSQLETKYASKCYNTIGANEITVGTFTTDTGWTKGTGWSITSARAQCNGSQVAVSSIVDTTDTILINTPYFIVHDQVVRNAGNQTPVVGGVVCNISTTTTSYYNYITTTTSDGYSFLADADFVGAVDNARAYILSNLVDTRTAGQGSTFLGVALSLKEVSGAFNSSQFGAYRWGNPYSYWGNRTSWK